MPLWEPHEPILPKTTTKILAKQLISTILELWKLTQATEWMNCASSIQKEIQILSLWYFNLGYFHPISLPYLVVQKCCSHEKPAASQSVYRTDLWNSVKMPIPKALWNGRINIRRNNHPNSMKNINLHIWETQKTPSQINSKRSTQSQTVKKQRPLDSSKRHYLSHTRQPQ